MPYKKDAKDANASYDKLRADLKSGDVGTCYIFHGQEQYLLQHSLARLRALLCPDGLDSFNYKRFDGSATPIGTLREAADALPFFCERTLIEVHEFELFKRAEAEREELCEFIADLPEHACVVFVYSAIEYNPDKRLKTTKDLLKHAEAVEFAVQEESKLVKWIIGHFEQAGKEISRQDAMYLAEITGGLMNSLSSEIEKVAAYSGSPQIKRSDIDAVVVPVLDAVAWRLTDALVQRNHKKAMQILDTLLQMREVPHKLIFSISLKMRQLLAARVCIESKISKGEFMKMSGVYSDYPAEILMNTARKTTLGYCRNAVLACSQTAKELNSASEPEARIIELVAKLALAN